MSYHPIHDVWILARAKLKGGRKYYGAYLGGFPERARRLLGITITDPLLHVCGGMARHYPYADGFGPNDRTLDIDPALEPDIVHDAREPLPKPECLVCEVKHSAMWPAILADPPYSEQDAACYAAGRGSYPPVNTVLKNCINAVRVGGRVGVIHYIWPSPPKNAKSIAVVGVLSGFNNRMRCFSVFERTP